VADRLAERWSPQQIRRALRAAHLDDPEMRLATERIYPALSGQRTTL
jgi:IS30 family transposase